jgi:hypothetical protein
MQRLAPTLKATFGMSRPFFVTSAMAAQRYAEHLCYQEHSSSATSEEQLDELLLEQNFVLYPVRVTLNNGVILDRPFLRTVGVSLGVPALRVAELMRGIQAQQT